MFFLVLFHECTIHIQDDFTYPLLQCNSYLTTVNGVYLQLTYNSYQTTARESSTGQGVQQGYMYSTRNEGVSGQLNVQ